MFEEVSSERVLHVFDFGLHDSDMGVDSFEPIRYVGVVSGILASEHLEKYGGK